MKREQLYAGLDVHSMFTYGTVLGEEGDVLGEGKFLTSPQGFTKFFKKFKDYDVNVVFEASRSWSYIAELLHAQGVSFVMAHPLKVKAIASARIKTDKIDSKILAHLLRTNMVPESYMPSQEVVDLRNVVRHRVKLGRTGTYAKNNIRTILAREGKKCHWSDVGGVKARAWLSKVRLSPTNRMELDDYLSMLVDVKEKIEALNKRISEEVVKYPDIKLISSIPGFAEYSSLLVYSEVGDFKRFPSPEKLAAYAGLVSSTYQSSSTLRRGKITKQGNSWLRWMLIECCSITIRHDNRLRKFYLRLKTKKGHQKAIVATARKALTIIWKKVLHTQQAFQP